MAPENFHVNFSAGDLPLLLVATRMVGPSSEHEVHQAWARVVGGPGLRILNSLIICQRIKTARLLEKCVQKFPRGTQSMDAILPLPSLFFGFPRYVWSLPFT